MMNHAAQRKRLLAWVRSQLIGPVEHAHDGDPSGMRPVDRFPCGILFPVVRRESGIDVTDDDVDEEESEAAVDAKRPADVPAQPARKRRHVPPSAAGFSFFIRGAKIGFRIVVSATAYRLEGQRDDQGRFTTEEWLREPLQCSSAEEDQLVLNSPDDRSRPSDKRIAVFGPRGEVAVMWRPYRGGWLITVSLCNKNHLPDDCSPSEWARLRNSESLFEASLRCLIDNGEVGDYPRVERSLLSHEEREIELQYRSRRIFAIGHGCAADWTESSPGQVVEIRTEFLPSVEVPTVTTNVSGVADEVMEIERLAEIGRDSAASGTMIADLRPFVDGYADWIERQRNEATRPDDKEAAGRIVNRMHEALRRMNGGLALLERSPDVAKAFGLANRAMAMQMRQTAKIGGKHAKPPAWRPFQLAFLLATIESVTNEESFDREFVDLIWFPTGGGKTEAYLGLIAFLVAWRRRRHPQSCGGTTAIMRYTLRLLTAQQFDRASRLICALEIIRRNDPAALLGDEPVSLGMWVGGSTTPNKYQQACDAVRQAEETRTLPHNLSLRSCPWCGTGFRSTANYLATSESFKFVCDRPGCDLVADGSGEIPCQVVDAALYDHPPTLLIATIDKFARLPWEEEAGKFFGNNDKRPPELVIQDELHLISGALGSIAGLYEAAIDTVLASKGVPPKYIASTATIRMAKEQVRALYGREVAVFPPPGLDCDDSYFARTEPITEKPGRQYVGYFAPLLDRQHCLAPLAAALLAAPEAVFGGRQSDGEDLLDAWWTMVVYHGSLKGVGTSHNAFEMDVAANLKRLADERVSALRDGVLPPDHSLIARAKPRIRQLTSNASAPENERTLACLKHPRGHPEVIDAVLATNMISVGLDVERLALMVINGQPLTTGEYIQSTSRVGRGKVPGLVFANYYRDQARSLSHFENFRPYHESFYRFVEPSSVTPFTWQARSRALHAALVIVVRHAIKRMAKDTAASDFRMDDPECRKVIDDLARRCERACPGRGLEIRDHLESLARKWDEHAGFAKERYSLAYDPPKNDMASERLLFAHGDRLSGLWETMNSMRNVEDTGLLKRL